LRPAIGLGVRSHAAEFEDGEYAAVQPHPLLPIEYRAGALELDQACGNGEQRKGEDEQARAHRDIEGSLQELVDRPAAEAVGVKEPARLQCLEIDRSGLALPEIEEIDHPDAGQLAM